MMKKSLIPAVTQALRFSAWCCPGAARRSSRRDPRRAARWWSTWRWTTTFGKSIRRSLAALRAGWRPGMELWVYADTPEGASLGRMESAPEGVTLRTVERYGAGELGLGRDAGARASHGVGSVARQRVTVFCSSRTPRAGFRRADCRLRS